MDPNSLRKLLVKNKFEEFVDAIFSYYNLSKFELIEIDNLSGQFNSIKSRFLLGLLSNEEYSKYENRIRLAFLDKIGELKSLESNRIPIFWRQALTPKFQCDGKEPNWNLEINDKRIIFDKLSSRETSIYPHEHIFVGEGIWHFRSSILFQSNISKISVTITEEVWQNDTGDAEYDYRVELIENFKVFIGGGKVV